MSANGMLVPEEAHTVPALPPQDINGGVQSVWWRMTTYARAAVVVGFGTTAAAPTAIRVQAAADDTGTDAEDIGFAYYPEETAGADTPGPRATADATGLTPAGTDDIFYVLDIDARDLPDGKPWLSVAIDAGADSIMAHVTAVLTGPRYAGRDQPSVLT